MRNPWHEELALIRKLEEEHGDQGGRGRGLLYGAPLALLLWALILWLILA